ncbi:HNH endonuclease [Anaerovorax odorimutans]|uniref:HNH endonuclease n=1 Tax=Anaerovorax odorimutans TaxID=109327 RepID=A0ABT1RR69_9FIRM|nr:HNH endonuclease signature motif containing protein [Anaerovorax odorimutans]MCQ4637682.1 HNH endonuclease [Anaerovorax odorimutans]
MIYDRCPRCNKRILAGTKCKNCQPEKRTYQKKNNANQYAAFYNSAQWQRVREAARAKYNNLDLYSLYVLQRVEQSDVVHHIDPVKKAWDKRYCIDNLIPLTNRNHQEIHKRMDEGDNIAGVLQELKARYENEFGGLPQP